jgi:cytochrome c oxidase assembly protein subunit 15
VSPVGTVTRRIFLAVIVAQIGITITGGLVRLTGSGLGCPTWPECTDGALAPVREQVEGLHSYIEFGNRLLTFVVGLVVIASIVAAWRHRPRRMSLVLLAAAGLLGVVGQAVLGGITVLTGLHPATVAAHFLLSMVLVAVATVLYYRGNESGDGPPSATVRPELFWLARGLLVLGAAVLTVGTIVTGSGPHSGDADTPARFGFDPRVVAWLHADLVILFIGLLAALLLAAHLTNAPGQVRTAAWWVLGVSLAQGLVGYVQFFTGLPEVLVALHLAGAGILWALIVRMVLTTRTRSGAPAEEVESPQPAQQTVG